ncbi:MAG: DM13 domain-containing protein [Gammaproteobacteria bacterium]|nr:DM13 domain-containing protein [Gammaproteobacteria bacterium]
MNKRLLVMTHIVVLGIGFVLGIYALPILIAPDSPSGADLERVMSGAAYSGEFKRELRGSDFLHWGEGRVTVGSDAVALMGRLAPGPDYRLYLAPEFVEDEAGFQRVKASSVDIGAVRTFENFIVPIPPSVDAAEYNTVVVWCEAFSEFISAAQYR